MLENRLDRFGTGLHIYDINDLFKSEDYQKYVKENLKDDQELLKERNKMIRNLKKLGITVNVGRITKDSKNISSCIK